MKYLLTLDVGTTAVKAGLFSQTLEALAFRIREYSLLTPKPDCVELEPECYWQNACSAIREVLADSGVDAGDVLCVTCTTQGETLIPVGAEGQALHNAVVWLDSRAKEDAQWIAGRVDPLRLYQKTGLPEVNAFTPLAKLLWFKRCEPVIYAAAEKFLLLEDYLIFRLTGRFVTNPALMCTTGYFDIQNDCLWTEMLEACGLDAGKLPQVLPCATAVGTLKPSAAVATGLPASVLVTTGAMDQVASALGSGNLTEGIVTETTGTCQAVAATVEKAFFPALSPVTYYSHAVKGKLLKIVINQTAGIAYKWFRDEFCLDLIRDGQDAFALMDGLAAREPAMSRGLSLFPHMTGMQFPLTDENIRGAFIGVSLSTGRGCFIRAIMEGVGFMLRESMEQMRLTPTRVISLGGGAKSAVWGQIKASVCNVDVLTLRNGESTSLGAAMLGGCAVGVFSNLESACEHLTIQSSLSPIPADKEAYEKGYARYLRMYGRLAPLFQTTKEE